MRRVWERRVSEMLIKRSVSVETSGKDGLVKKEEKKIRKKRDDKFMVKKK